MAPEGSAELHRTLSAEREERERIGRKVAVSLRLNLPDVIEENVVDMILDLKVRELPQVRVVDVEGGTYFLVVAKDWPGLSDASLAVVHEKGYNLSMVFGVQIVDTPYSVMIMQISPDENTDRKRLLRDREEIVTLLRTVAKGGLDIRTILGAESRKLRVYDRVLKEIDRMVEEGKLTRKLKARIVGDEGELIKFIRSRTIAYLEERSPRTLAEIVKMQVELADKARKNPENVYVDFHLFKVGPEGKRNKDMVGFTIVGKSGLVKLSDVLHVFRKQGIVERYRKEFILPDGISVVRVEIDGTYQKMLMTLKEELQNLRVPQDDEGIAPGEEIFGRMVSDRLMREYGTSGIPQLLTMHVTGNIYRASAVGPALGETADEAEDRIEEAFRKRNLTVTDAIVKFFERERGQTGLYIIKFHPNVPIKHVHERVKEAFGDLFGPEKGIRDFDESLRRINYEKLSALYEILAENVPRKFIGDIFYSLKDELRIMEPVEVLAAIISHIFSSVEAFLEKKQGGEKGRGIYSTTVSHYLITTVVCDKSCSKEEREQFQEKYGRRISRLSIYGSEVQTYMKKVARDESVKKEKEKPVS